MKRYCLNRKVSLKFIIIMICCSLLPVLTVSCWNNLDELHSKFSPDAGPADSGDTVFRSSLPHTDTGQSQCYYFNGTDWVEDSACSQTYSSATPNYPAGQDGHYTSPAPRNFSGPVLYGASDRTTTDNSTGLVWKTCTQGCLGDTCSDSQGTTHTWDEAVSQCSALNTANAGAGYAGRTNWRLPEVQELISIVDLGKDHPAIDPAYFPNTRSEGYWSSTNLVGVADSVWIVSFGYGSAGGSPTTADFKSYVRCVSGP